MAGLRERFPLIPYNPNRQGSNRKSPVEKLELLPHLWQPLLPFFVTRFLIWHLLIWSGFLLVSPQGVGGRLRLQKSQRENEHFAFNCSPFGTSFPAASEEKRRQTDIQRSFLSFFIPIVKLIYSRIFLDAGCHVSYWLFSSHSRSHHPQALMEQRGRVGAPEDRYIQLCTRHFTLVVTVGNIQRNSIYTAFRQM